MPKFVFSAQYFIRSRDGVLRHLEGSSFTKVSVFQIDQIPTYREYIVYVPKDTKVSKKFLKDTPANVVFVIDDENGSLCASDDNIKATQSRKCFYIRKSDGDTFTDGRFPGLYLQHLIHNGHAWECDYLTFAGYFDKVISKTLSVKVSQQRRDAIMKQLESTNWHEPFENALVKGLELQEKSIENYLKKAIEVIPKMVEQGKYEMNFYEISDVIVNELSKYSPENVKWVRKANGNVFLVVSI